MTINNNVLIFQLIFLLLVAPSSSFASVYKCEIDGKTVFTDKPCDADVEPVIGERRRQPEPTPSTVAAPNSQDTATSSLASVDLPPVKDVLDAVATLELISDDGYECKIDLQIRDEVNQERCGRFIAAIKEGGVFIQSVNLIRDEINTKGEESPHIARIQSALRHGKQVVEYKNFIMRHMGISP